MIEIRRSKERGHAQHGWLESYHTFAFSNYYDPRFVGFRSLLVINEDRVQGGRGFGMHSHEDMDILSYVIEGGLAHKDSLGAGSVLKAGDVQIICAGTGIAHSEFNASTSEPVHFLQIWMIPDRQGLKPGYAEQHFSAEQKTKRLKLIGSKDGREGSMTIHQDIDLYASLLEAQEALEHPVRRGSGVWIQLISGSLDVNSVRMEVGDGIRVEDEKTLSLSAAARCEFLLFDIGSFEG